MAQAIFITRDDITKFTALNGNVDTDRFIQYIKLAQDIHIQNYLGTDLFNKINDDIVNSTLSGNYLTLLNTYIKPMVIHWAFYEYLPWSGVTIGNKGVFRHTSENAETATPEDLDKLAQKQMNIAQHYTQRFIDYMCNYSSLYPEYNSNSNGDMSPSKNNTFNGWVL